MGEEADESSRRQRSRREQQPRQPHNIKKRLGCKPGDGGGGDRGQRGQRADKYVGHGRIERRGGSLLKKLLKDDKHKQDATLLQVIRYLATAAMSGD
mmetsp:Transcript_26792/g.65119  ORF Transcript_26792/g.65119 Transcript_26792/m.65119 type:complete len:97 (+) Transcript_26792:79-369(+)